MGELSVTSGEQERKLGVVTIGQAPRDDVMPQMIPLLPEGLKIEQAGALDGLTDRQIAELEGGPRDYVLHTLLRDGRAVSVARDQIVGLMQRRIDQLAKAGASPILLLCTGEFPQLQSEVLLIQLDQVLVKVIHGLGPRRLGVCVPLPSQIDAAAEKWKPVNAKTTVVAASPYDDQDDLMRAAGELRGRPLDFVVMDCVGYNRGHRQLVARMTGKPTLLASSLVARVLAELLDP